MLDFIQGLVNEMIGDSFNVAACAVEEFLAATIGKMEEMMNDLLGDVMSGLDWLCWWCWRYRQVIFVRVLV